ncbi:hypothetical protein CVT24_009979 [Panaeolus cyanescens]|uniref:Tetraspanin n=1 Tax=Panaeolus cyanescens TaxID=181874 RepID=A0A409VXE6_9AGAR|nr:hypothetical protein CVT24_009979 [Panaeolus cyanescens]
MVSKRLMGVWAALDILLLAAGVIALVLSMVWRAPNVLMNMVLSSADLTAGTILGIALLITFVISVAAIVQRNHVTIGLVILNYALLADALAILVIGTFVWFYTLRERDEFHKLWIDAPRETRILLQDQFKCCGYFNGTDAAEIGGSFCTSQDVINGLNADVATNFSRYIHTRILDTCGSLTDLMVPFLQVYGFMAIVLCLLLASLCVIKKRQEDERFKKIDAKRGGRGFV